MQIDPSRAPVRALLPLFSAAAMLAAAGCNGPAPPPPPPSPLTVTTSDAGPGAIPVGQDAIFTIVVRNPSQEEVRGVRIFDSPSANLRFKSMTCSAQGATCPAADSLTIGTVPGGGVLTFTTTATVIDHPIENVVQVASTDFETIIVRGHGAVANPADDVYRVYVGDGNVVGLRLDLTGHRAGISSPSVAVPVMQALSDDADGSHATATGLRLRTAPGLVLGTYDFGAGPEPFVAIDAPLLYVQDLDGLSFNTFERAHLASGAVTTRAFATWFTGSTMHVCADAHPYAADRCPGAAQRHYQVTSLTYGSFTATDSTGGDVQNFMIARSGAARVFVRADRTPAGAFFAAGLQANAGPAPLTADGGSSRGDWDRLVLTATSFSARPIAPDGTLGTPTTQIALAPAASGPPGLVSGPRTTDGATLHVAADGPLAFAVGAPDGTANGEFHFYVR